MNEFNNLSSWLSIIGRSVAVLGAFALAWAVLTKSLTPVTSGLVAIALILQALELFCEVMIGCLLRVAERDEA